MKQFSIYSPVLGKREDIPHIFLQKTMTPDTQNCQFWDGKVRTVQGRSPSVNATKEIDGLVTGQAVAVLDGNPVIKYLNHQVNSGSKHLLAFTKLNVYRWISADSLWTAMNTAASVEVTHWSVAQINGQVVATDGERPPIKWDGNTANTFALLNADLGGDGTITQAKVCINYENHIVFGNYDTSGGNTYENGLVMSDLDDPDQWTIGTGDASAYYSEGDGTISGLGKKRDLLYVFKTRSARVWWYTGTDAIMHSRNYSESVGINCPDSIGNDGEGNLYYMGSDFSIREVEQGRISQPYIETMRNISQIDTAIIGVKFAYIAEYNEIWWACPVDGSETNNIILCYQLNGIWYERNIPVSAFGTYEPSDDKSFTWDNQPEGTWDEWGGIWDDATESAGWKTDICGDASGYTYEVHGNAAGDKYWDGAAMTLTDLTCYFVMTTDLGNKQSLRYFKRLLYMYAYFTSKGQSAASIYIKEDSAGAWGDAVGTIDTDGTPVIAITEIPLDHRARTFLIKIESDKPFEFLGAEFEYIDSGLR